MKNLATLSLLSVLSLALGDGMKWMPAEFPSPKDDPDACGRGGLSSHICDPGNFLENSQANYLDNLIRKVKEDTPCNCSAHYCENLQVGGAKIGIAIVGEMMTEEEANGQEKPKFQLQRTLEYAAQFAQYVDEKWHLGHCGETIIIFYSAKDHVLFTHTGEKVAKTLTNKMLAEISMKHRYRFEDGQYYEGLANLINDYREVLLGRYEHRVEDPRRPAEPQALLSQSGAASLAASLLMVVATTLLHL